MVIYADLTDDSFVMIWRPEGGTAVRTDLSESGQHAWYSRVADSDIVMIEHVEWALYESARRQMSQLPSQAIYYEFRLKP